MKSIRILLIAGAAMYMQAALGHEGEVYEKKIGGNEK